MAEEYKVGNIKNELQLFLSAQARKSAFLSAPLILKTEFRNTPYVSDSSKKLFSINMAHLISFRDYFNDKTYKNIRLYDWEFNLKFTGKRCTSIELESQHIALIASKNMIKQIKDCTFSLEIANQSDIQEFEQSYKGYLNRLGKRNLVANSEYVAEEYHNLISFVKKSLSYSAVEKICMPVQKAEPVVEPLTYLNQRGKDLLQKLRHFITKQDLLNFMVEQQLSEEGEKQMRRHILSEAIGGNKKKAVYTRNIIESLQKNITQ